MSKDDGCLTRRVTGERSSTAPVRRPMGGRSQPPTGRETQMDRRVASPTGARRRGVGQNLTLLAADLGRVAAQAVRHVRIRRFSAALADTHQLICKHPLQAVLVGTALGYLLSRTKVK